MYLVFFFKLVFSKSYNGYVSIMLKVDRSLLTMLKSYIVSVYEKNIERVFSQHGDWHLLNTAVYTNESKIRSTLKNKGRLLFSVFVSGWLYRELFY